MSALAVTLLIAAPGLALLAWCVAALAMCHVHDSEWLGND